LIDRIDPLIDRIDPLIDRIDQQAMLAPVGMWRTL
jgi:hypothetical protein